MACRLLFVTLLLAALPGHRGHATIVTGLDLVQQCEKLDRVAKPAGPNSFRWSPDQEADTCWGYVGAIHGLSAIGDPETGVSVVGTCIPAEVRTMQIVRAITAYGRSHPKELPRRAALLALRALDFAFPCR